MNVLSLFDGMSCGRIALERAGVPVTNYYAAEIDKWAIKIAKKNYPDTIHLGDVRDVHDFILPEIDLLIGGSPCQGFSFAGKMLNFDDPRSKLFFEFVRLKEELNPKWFLLENVKMKKESQAIISKYLGVEPIEINSALVSAQNRRRLYWTNIPFDGLPEDKGIVLKDILLDYTDDKYVLSDTALRRIDRKTYSSPKVMPGKTGTLNTKNNSGALSVDSGTTLIPFILSEDAVERTLDACAPKTWKSGNKMGRVPFPTNIDGKAKTLCTTNGDGNRAVNYVPVRVATDEGIKGHDYNKRAYSAEGKSPCLNTGSGGSTYPKITQIGVIKNKGEFQVRNEKSMCLDANYFKGPDNHGQRTLIQEGVLYRRLTPVECERLQTVPDNYTEGVSDTQRYKMLGNGWTVDVIAHIFKGLL